MEENNDKKIKIDKEKLLNGTIIATLSIVFSFLIIYSFLVIAKPILNKEAGNNITGTSTTSEYITAIEEAITKVKTKYINIDEVSMEELIEGAISGIAEATGDPYTRYVSQDEYNEMLTTGTEEYGGIGIHLTFDKESGGILVVGVMPDSPALNAGIKPGDIIAKVGSTTVSIDTYRQCVDDMKGEEGSTVHLTVLRNNDVLEKDVTRKKITANYVESDILDSNIGYIKILSFENKVYEQFKKEYDKLMAQNVKGLVIDVRDNPGGLVSETIKILDLLLPKGEVLKLVYKDGSQKVYKCSNNEQIEIPLAIVANSRSASAAEILSSAVKDSGKGALVGNKTYGKGIVQEVIKLNNDKGALSITVAKYYTASGIEIHKNGIEPSIAVELPEEYKNENVIPRDKDNQLQKAIEYINSK